MATYKMPDYSKDIPSDRIVINYSSFLSDYTSKMFYGSWVDKSPLEEEPKQEKSKKLKPSTILEFLND